jgi:DNA-binding FrmR family transcriptional regulator
MTHISRERSELVPRAKKLIGQLESVQSAIEDDSHCADILQRLAAARSSINNLMGELMEDPSAITCRGKINPPKMLLAI